MFSANSSQVSEDRLYVEDVFSTYLYTGNSSTQTITNGIDLAGKGGMVWQKGRSGTRGTGNNYLFDTSRGALQTISSNTTEASYNRADSLTAFNSNGFTLGSNAFQNETGSNFASWTFREAPKFFDVVTYTGNGVNGRQIAHNLGVTPGFIIYKCTSTATSWLVLHRSLPNGFSDAINLNTTDAAFSLGASFAPTATTFTMSNGVDWNQNGQTYVAYLFAHDTTSDGIIQCGSFTTDAGGNFSVSLGWEPQFVIAKRTDAAQNWFMADTMRGFSQTQFNTLNPNLSNAEAANSSNYIAPNATGFGSIGNQFLSGSASYIYIAIRRGPMRTPTSGTSVFQPLTWTGTGTSTTITSGITADTYISQSRNGIDPSWFDRLRGPLQMLKSNVTNGEITASTSLTGFDNNTGVSVGPNNFGGSTINFSSYPYAQWIFKRAPSFFDVVCYTGTGVAGRTVSHNLGVAPELIIVKCRSNADNWPVLATINPQAIFLNFSDAGNSAFAKYYFGDNTSYIAPTSSVFSVATDGAVNTNGRTYVSYLFASCPGVSKVGSYTGNGSSQTINCGFAAGARFVMIKRTDSTGNWLVADSARGIVAANDPLLYLNSAMSEITSLDWIDANSSGFIVNQDSTANANVNGATYIYLAVA